MEPPGQGVSGCNHQANELDLTGRKRKKFVERCIAAGGDRWTPEDRGRNCRERAATMRLEEDARDDFLRRCRAYREGSDETAGHAERLRRCEADANQAKVPQARRDEFLRACMEPAGAETRGKSATDADGEDGPPAGPGETDRPGKPEKQEMPGKFRNVEPRSR